MGYGEASMMMMMGNKARRVCDVAGRYGVHLEHTNEDAPRRQTTTLAAEELPTHTITAEELRNPQISDRNCSSLRTAK